MIIKVAISYGHECLTCHNSLCECNYFLFNIYGFKHMILCAQECHGSRNLHWPKLSWYIIVSHIKRWYWCNSQCVCVCVCMYVCVMLSLTYHFAHLFSYPQNERWPIHMTYVSSEECTPKDTSRTINTWTTTYNYGWWGPTWMNLVKSGSSYLIFDRV